MRMYLDLRPEDTEETLLVELVHAGTITMQDRSERVRTGALGRDFKVIPMRVAVIEFRVLESTNPDRNAGEVFSHVMREGLAASAWFAKQPGVLRDAIDTGEFPEGQRLLVKATRIESIRGLYFTSVNYET